MLTNILQAIGNTPMLRLDLSKDMPGTVWLKLENRNPGGSIKDRVAFHLIENALQWGELEPGGLVVEATSGNMGIGIALVSAVRGLRCVLAMPESMSLERRNLLRGLGAELVLTPAARGMTGAVEEARRIAEEQGGFIPGQFTNPEAVQAHYKTTGPEIYSDSVGKMDVLVAGVGSGSSITGAGRFLKERIPGFRVIAVEPAASPVISGGAASPHLIQGIGAGFIPAILDRSLLDEILLADGEEALDTARLLMRQGIVAGISTGANVRAALQVAARQEMAGKNIVTFACDTGERYMSTRLFTDMAQA
ncbi:MULTISPECIES: cysteine synthase A [Desulfovibrio]|uniref:Cysteine synthase n=3 Tax=Desulfovibrio TaxID=872 RepID=A0AA94L2B8_DESDE|nr:MULTISPECIES: cysteine synthase A [Desulfovibrio]ATD80128.1 cysteine synthase A [Desulfovibrio sp. G11]MDY0203544.1 cysteine synthase A [Desulfovibrio desulfuricans]SFW50738.1 cysteine synthase A [Desulfovibrio desulfuricans]SPD35582.1 cysteine synthase [Desulfovibrio sp. G11]